jgi:hypothetical protein
MPVKKQRPKSSAVCKPPSRNIKSIVNVQDMKSFEVEGSILKNKLANMTVLESKQQLMNGWIDEELSRFQQQQQPLGHK